jgi:hypothetical protein
MRPGLIQIAATNLISAMSTPLFDTFGGNHTFTAGKKAICIPISRAGNPLKTRGHPVHKQSV